MPQVDSQIVGRKVGFLRTNTQRAQQTTAEMDATFFYIFGGDFFIFFSYYIQHCFICRPLDSTVPTDAGIETRTVATGALTVRRTRLDLIRTRLDLIRNLNSFVVDPDP